MAQVEILSEKDRPSGWEFSAQVLDDAGRIKACRMTLSWADYNLWSADGSDAPALVAEAVISFLVSRDHSVELADHFDASLARRKFRDADEQIPRFIER
ncbi:MAG: hypothetical protein L0Y44_11370 [Phycisphaerales bacterium]|nr:hypothetical protein [Phycisphaerales bacterium]MCI0631239.1 hypothetical protein [Phycisphaerales bacterium]MCI0677100.1 hypothetical protein [Phycisphaerales bacterium]